MPSQPTTACAADIRSASPWIGARDRRAFDTIATICASTVSDPTLAASITREPFLLIVAPVTASPGPFSTGIDSPVNMLSSSEDRPSITVPSTGTASPGRTRSRSPAMMFSSGASYSLPSCKMRRAVFGARSGSARIASPVRARAQFQHLTHEDQRHPEHDRHRVGVLDRLHRRHRVDGADLDAARDLAQDDVAGQHFAHPRLDPDGLIRPSGIADAEDAIARHRDVQRLLHRRLDVDLGQDAEAMVSAGPLRARAST